MSRRHWGKSLTLEEKNMKYVKKMPAIDHELSIRLFSDGFKKIKEPGNLALAVLLSFPFVFVLGGVTAWLAYLLKPELFAFMQSESFHITIPIDIKSLLFLIMVFVYMFIHEMIHVIFIPDFLKSDKTYWGLNGLFGFVFTTEPIKKFRFIIISVMPFFLLSLVALVIFYFVGLLNWFTLGLCLINAAGSCVDFLNLLLIATQVKNGQIIINNGFETYYK